MTKLAEAESLFDVVEVLEEVEAKPRKWKTHQSYKPSAMEWLDQIPSHWEARRLKFIADVRTSNVDKKSVENEPPVELCNYVDVYHNDYITDAITFMKATASEDQIERFSLAKGDVLITKDSETWDDIAVPAYVDQELPGVVCGYHLALVRPRSGVLSGEYLFRAFGAYALRDQFMVRANGITRYGLSSDAVTSAQFPVPPLPEQRAIAAFLRRETTKIDGLMEKKRRLIDLLKEKRTALISHAVTKGLNRNAKMKPSALAELGDIPEHWTATRLMLLTQPGHRIMYGIVLPGPHFPGGVPIVKGGDVERGALHRDRLSCTDPEIEAGYERSRLRSGDLVYAIRGSIGACQPVPPECAGVNITQDAAKIAPREDLDRRWLLAGMQSQPVFQQLEARALGATIRGINIRDLKRCYIPLPPSHEQTEIADFLDGAVGTLDRAADLAELAIAQLTEYRAALISAAVTGKIDVREEDLGGPGAQHGKAVSEGTSHGPIRV